MARADDYNSLGAIGELLRKNSDMKTLKDIGSEGANKTEKLLRLKELESSSHVCLLRRINNFDCYFFENEIFLLLGDFMNAMRTSHLRLAALEQEKADENVQKLVDKQTRETKTILDDFLRLNTQLEMKQKVELEIKHLSGKLQVMELKLVYCSVSVSVFVYENSCLVQLQSLQSLPGTASCRTHIGVKKLGELDPSVFLSLCKRKFPAADAEAESASLCSKWQNEIENPEWQPFKVIIVDGKASEVLKEDDRKLRELKELGKEPYAAVTKALLELKDSNGSRKDPFTELWNYDECRKANMVEGVRFALKLCNDYYLVCCNSEPSVSLTLCMTNDSFFPLLLEILKMRQLGQQNTQRVVEENRKLRYDIQDMVDALDARNKQIKESEHDKKNLEQEKLIRWAIAFI
ncbi:unnamed protein product [Miscanthus lutarioriparius]|uniref:Factor of DNA methylation 1-5/IDN2 domain-containing protein n=1 Tax=Miscanthus lutarioriparius TaxID=422564 RepID=A0A811PA51_9POAL|nr:unnamed protein product [Miscanthus lutarioriparius]